MGLGDVEVLDPTDGFTYESKHLEGRSATAYVKLLSTVVLRGKSFPTFFLWLYVAGML